MKLTDQQGHERDYIFTIHIKELTAWEDMVGDAYALIDDLSTSTSAYIEKISCDGKMYVRFNRTMVLPDPFKNRKIYAEWLGTLN